MYSFLNDYSEGCHPRILTALAETNALQQNGYGTDDYSQAAANVLREKLSAPDALVRFVTGGTQANLLSLAAVLKPFEAIIAPETGHISSNEAGAIEATGHKIITMPSDDGKLTVKDIETALTQFSLFPHMVRPKLVYISNTTEIGTVYTRAELAALSACCRQHDLYLFIDGARLGVALASPINDVSLADIAEFADMFWLGGTKMGALLGEAIVITNPSLQPDFDFHLKQRGALLAKGRLLGLQFLTLFEADLYLTLSHHANQMATKLSEGLVSKGYQLFAPTESNQVFPILPLRVIEKMGQSFGFYTWKAYDNDTAVVRLVTSWATIPDEADKFVNQLPHCH